MLNAEARRSRGRTLSGTLASTLRHKSLDTLASHQAARPPTSTSPMTRHPVQLSVRRVQRTHQNAAVIQTCVPTVALKGDSYRLKDRDLTRPGKD
jgi:hypothetical protein